MKRIILAITVLVILSIFYSLLSSENINSLEGEFEELAFERNENNTGPVRRVYAYSLKDTLWEEMEKHADLLPHTKYGTTDVYYFLKEDVSKLNLALSLNGISDDSKLFCIAKAAKNGQAKISFKRYPF